MIRRSYSSLLVLCMLAACASNPPGYDAPQQAIRSEMAKASTATVAPAPTPAPVARPDPLAPPPRAAVAQKRFDLAVNNAPAAQVLLSIVSGTPYSMLLPPDLSGTISMNLREVTVMEALQAIRQVYGYEFRVDGTRIAVMPQTMQTRVMQINYLDIKRKSISDVRVISGSVSDGSSTGSTTNSSSGTTTQTSGGSSSNFVANQLTTNTKSDFWTELMSVLQLIIGEGDGRKVVVSPQAGLVVVRAMPSELALVEHYLRSAKLSLERQVILEAKIIEVQLNNQFQAGINWAAFGNGSSGSVSAGPIAPGMTLSNDGSAQIGNIITGVAGQTLSNAITSAGTMFGLVFQSGNFAAVLNLLEQQGKVHVLSSPRISALNNQPAVLKVGTDDFFVTNVSSTVTTGVSSTSTPTVTLQPFFSGILLDVTPSIDDQRQVTLHVHPSVSDVTEVTRRINLGNLGTLTLPLASSKVSETASVVRGQDGQIIALGGLIREALTDDVDQVPVLGGLPVLGSLFRSTGKKMVKRELVILIRPTIVDSNVAWSDDLKGADTRLNKLLELDNLKFDNELRQSK
ncbi:pilus (MSHA type) biogenesis protein MshL [Niveibacterium sp. 24ML]|uniref:pilus (MSHA type) biogenesis protein MshL n=1 Tax=Niveibacterium sp. 24ML TaxID=2985512 RepID=UPI0022710EAF|nr:pilus (MSHA type) biogenesis protein MshL [Niveibacterium sp. 24ML]MCX9155084.1 pilus (MSHA type) biogenesis protein MshL [Niveibacterium sp. 24ML]